MKLRRKPCTPAQRIRVNALRRTSVHPRDRAACPDGSGAPQSAAPAATTNATRQRGTVCPDGGGAPQSAAPAATTNAMQQRGTVRPHGSGAPQSAALTRRQEQHFEELIAAVEALGFFPRESKPTGDAGTEEFRLAGEQFALAQNLRKFPCTPAQRTRVNALRRTLATRVQEQRFEELIAAVEAQGFFPRESKPTGDAGTEEFQLATDEYLLARKLRRNPCTLAQRTRVNALRRT